MYGIINSNEWFPSSRTLKGKIAKQYPEAFSSMLETWLQSLLHNRSCIILFIMCVLLLRHPRITHPRGWRWWVWSDSTWCYAKNPYRHLRAEHRVLWHKSRCYLPHYKQMLWRSFTRHLWNPYLRCHGNPSGRGSWFCTCRIDHYSFFFLAFKLF